MLRFILHLFNIKGFEFCRSCEILKQQLQIANEDRERLTDTLLKIVNPKVFSSEPPVELSPIQQTSALFGKRRAAMEAKDREEARILKEAKHLGKPDIEATKHINELEKELGVDELEQTS